MSSPVKKTQKPVKRSKDHYKRYGYLYGRDERPQPIQLWYLAVGVFILMFIFIFAITR